MTTNDLYLSLLASPAAAGLARTFISQRLQKWDLQDIMDNALIVVSEIIVNATEAAPKAELRLHMAHEPRGVFIRLWDPSPYRPRLTQAPQLTLAAIDAAPEDAWDNGGGWGLPLVQALSAACGYTPTPPTGKWVWSRLVR